MKRLLIVAQLLVLAITSYSQGIKPGAILVGERVPIAEFHNVINYPSKTLKFVDHEPKLTILDVWSTACKGCIEAWPKMLKLQKEFGNDLQIILVNMYEDEKVVKDFLALRKKINGIEMNLPIVCGDSAVWKPFGRIGVPRYYWIDTNGVLASVTHGPYVTSENIRKWITTGPFEMEQIIEEFYSVKGNKPIFVDGNGGMGRGYAFIWSSSLTKSQPDIFGTTLEYSDPFKGYGLCVTGGDISTLYSTAYNDRLSPDSFLTWVHGSRLHVEARDTLMYYGYVNGIRTNAPMFNYQLIAGRALDRPGLQKTMREDLDRYFGLSATWEKRQKKCLVISMFDPMKAQAKSKMRQNYVGEEFVALDSVKVDQVIFFMEQGSFFYDKRPIVNETNFKGLLTGIKFEANSKDIKQFDKGLSKFGMHIKEEMREVDVLVLREPE